MADRVPAEVVFRGESVRRYKSGQTDIYLVNLAYMYEIGDKSRISSQYGVARGPKDDGLWGWEGVWCFRCLDGWIGDKGGRLVVSLEGE